jgi:hypothetical protein
MDRPENTFQQLQVFGLVFQFHEVLIEPIQVLGAFLNEFSDEIIHSACPTVFRQCYGCNRLANPTNGGLEGTNESRVIFLSAHACSCVTTASGYSAGESVANA